MTTTPDIAELRRLHAAACEPILWDGNESGAASRERVTDAIYALGSEMVDALPALLDAYEREAATARERSDLVDILLRNGFVRCDIPACNCNRWHPSGGFYARFREIDDAVGDHNGKTLLKAVEEIIAERDALRAKLSALVEAATLSVADWGTINQSLDIHDQLVAALRAAKEGAQP